jgi:hypothetical protein
VTDVLRPAYYDKLRLAIRKLNPAIYRSKKGAGRAGKTYASLNLGKLSAIEGGGYKLDEGAPTFVMANDKAGILEVIEQLMHRLDIALFEASLEPEDPPGF